MKLSAERILVVVAHPDDEVLGCGGTVARLARSADVRIVILGEGITSRFDARDDAADRDLTRLAGDAESAAEILGASSAEVLGLPDNRFDGSDLLDVIKLVEHRVSEFKPQLVFTHHPGDLNVDHSVTFRAVMTATRPAGGDGDVIDLLTCEIASSTEWAFQQVAPAFRPNVFVDISETIEAKVDAMEIYASEARPNPHPRSPEKLRALAASRGAAIGVDYAEAFELVRAGVDIG